MSEEDLAAHARLLERVGGEMARLQFFSARGAQLALMQQLAPRVARATTSAEARFSEALQTALGRGQHSTVAHCLHAFASINATAAGEAVIRLAVFFPHRDDIMAAFLQHVLLGILSLQLLHATAWHASCHVNRPPTNAPPSVRRVVVRPVVTELVAAAASGPAAAPGPDVLPKLLVRLEHCEVPKT